MLYFLELYLQHGYHGTFVAAIMKTPSISETFSSKVPTVLDDPLFPLVLLRSKISDSISSTKSTVGWFCTAMSIRISTAAAATPWYLLNSFPTDILMKQKSFDSAAALAAAFAIKVCAQRYKSPTILKLIPNLSYAHSIKTICNYINEDYLQLYTFTTFEKGGDLYIGQPFRFQEVHTARRLS